MRALVPGLSVILCFGLACTGVGATPPGKAPAEGAVHRDTPKPRKEKPESREGRRRPTAAPVDTEGPWVPAADPCAARATDGTFKMEFPWQGETTRAVLYVPATAGPHPLVVLLHAGDADAATILKQTRFDEKAKAEGFALLVPGAAAVHDRGLHWNSGKFSSIVPESEQRDDVAYLDAITALAKQQTCSDRVLTAGFSSGGQMNHRWACQGSEVDALLSAAGELLVDPSTCRGPRAVRGYVGDRDKVFDSGPLEGSDQPSAPQTVAMWAEINKCSKKKEPIETRVGDTVCKAWQGCEASTELCVIEGFPHGWPAPWNHRGLTETNATDAGWAWFTSTR